MLTKQQVADSVAWETVMAQPRYAGGHCDVMDNMFGESAEVIATWLEDDYQGDLAYAYRFTDGTIAIITDGFGSCCGCDSWEDAEDAEARNMIQELAINARLFATLDEAKEFCRTVEESAEQFLFRAAKNLDLDVACNPPDAPV